MRFVRGLLVAVALSLGASANAAAPTHHPTAAPSGHVRLPADDAMHPAAHNEWWYFVGHLTTKAGEHFGFETTLFKLLQVRFPGSSTSFNAYRSDVALTDVPRHAFYPSISVVEPGLGALHLSSSSLDERIATAALSRHGSTMLLSASTSDFRLELQLTPRRRPLLQGGTGIVPMGPGGYSYYYSRVDLHIVGQIRYRHHWLAVHGLGWFDHQWGNWNWATFRGWTWMALQLANGLDFSAEVFRATAGTRHTVDVSYPSGRQWDSHKMKSVHITALGSWRSPHDGGVYPSGWRVVVPKLRVNVVVRPLVKNQEMYIALAPAESYWEGDSSVSGTMGGKRITGQAYVELTGFAGTR